MPVWLLHVVGQVRQRVALRARRSGVISSSRPVKLTGWNDRKLIFSRVVERELDDLADLLVVHAVDDRDDRHDVDAGRVQVLDRLQLDVEQVADPAVRVGGVADAVELQVGEAQAGLGRRPREVRRPGELDAVGGRLHRGVADLAGVADGVEEDTATASARRPRTAPTSAAAA